MALRAVLLGGLRRHGGGVREGDKKRLSLKLGGVEKSQLLKLGMLECIEGLF